MSAETPATQKWAGRHVTRKCSKAHEKRVSSANIEQSDTEGRTFHIHPPTHGPFPLLPRTCDAPQPPIPVDTLRPAMPCEVGQRGRVRRAECRLRCPREERVDVVDLGVRLRQRDVMQRARVGALTTAVVIYPERSMQGIVRALHMSRQINNRL